MRDESDKVAADFGHNSSGRSDKGVMLCQRRLNIGHIEAFTQRAVVAVVAHAMHYETGSRNKAKNLATDLHG
jgi:uncharacterized protein (UPF0548 family)